jgi:hypothetical protein
MCLTLTTLLPNISSSLERTGFLFGSGTSFEAGYPMIGELTRNVVEKLTPNENAVLNEALSALSLIYNELNAIPNIEKISDIVIAHGINSNDLRFKMLENRLRELIIQEILSIKNINLDNHIHFFRALMNRSFGRHCIVWIFTTNYDLLFEIAAAKAGVVIENGFSGCIERFFNPNTFSTIYGKITGKKFIRNNQLVIKLVKLHGSISWISEDGQIFERCHNDNINTADRTMVLPRCKKIMETLSQPYETLFSYMRNILGKECKYLVSCGFSFNDEHINNNIILPSLQSGNIRMFTLNEFEPNGVANFKSLKSFNGGYSDKLFLSGNVKAHGTNAWQFSQFVKLF